MFFDPISKEDIKNLNYELKVTISGDLLSVLKETNGIRDKRDFYLFSSDKMIKKHREHIDYLKLIEEYAPCKFLFFADDGCGNGFAYKINNNGIIETEEIVVYYPMENDFKVIAPDFKSWVKGWYSGNLST